MMMVWKVMSKGSLVFQNAGGLWERCVLPLLTGAVCWYGRDGTTQRGRFHVVPRVPGRMRTGWAQLTGRILESGVGHC